MSEQDESKRHEIAAPVWTEEQLKRRRQRNLAVAWTLAGLMLLFFIKNMQQQLASRLR